MRCGCKETIQYGGHYGEEQHILFDPSSCVLPKLMKRVLSELSPDRKSRYLNIHGDQAWLAAMQQVLQWIEEDIDT